MWWLLFTFGELIGGAVKAEVNRIYVLDHHKLNFWRTCMALFLLVPVVSFLPVPTSPLFYVAACLVGVEATFSSLFLFRISSEVNGRVASLKKPVLALMIYFSWLIVDGQQWQNFKQEPLISSLILACVLCAFTMIFVMQRQPLSANILKQILPIAVLNTSVVLFVVVMLEHKVSAFTDMLWFYVFVMLVQMVYSGAVLYHRKDLQIDFVRQYRNPIVVASLSGLCGMFGWYAMLLAPNPAYPKIILMSTPLVLSLFYRVKGVQDTASPYASSVLVISVMCLLFLTTFY